MRQIESEKLKLILALKEIPIVIVACKKVGLNKSSFYRWKHEDKRFAREVTRAVSRGREDVSDIAEAHVVQGVKKGEKNYVMLWLRTHRSPYRRIEKTTVEIKQNNEFTMSTNKSERRGRRNALLPTISHEIPPMSPNLEKTLMAAATKIMADAFKEEKLIKALAKKGWSSEEISSLLKSIETRKATAKDWHDSRHE